MGERPDFDRIKATTDIVRVIESYGVALKRVGANWTGLCPFHDDKHPSLVVTPFKGLFHCPSCGAAGNVIQFVARKENLTDKEAALKLLGTIPGVTRGSTLEGARPPLIQPTPELFTGIINHYHETLFGRDRRGLDYLKSRNLANVEMLQRFKVGFVNGTVAKKLTPAQKKNSLFNEAGNEKFYLRVVVPIFNEQNQSVGLYGRSIQPDAEGKHLYLAGEHRGVFNWQAAQVYPDELIVAESILDAMSIYQNGKKNVIASYGTKGWTPTHAALIEKFAVKKLVIAYDNDGPNGAGHEAALKLATELDTKGVKCHRINWPVSVKDANDYFQYHRDTDFKGTPETFSSLLAVAPRIGFSRKPTSKLSIVEKTEESVTIQNGVVAYRVKGHEGLTSTGGLRVILSANKPDAPTSQHVDTIDLYVSKSRKIFASACAERLQIEAQKVEDDLLAMLELLENLRQEETRTPADKPAMTEEERKEALGLLSSPRLLDRIARDLEIVGYVGEARNKKLAYLIGTSRRLPKPLSGIFRAQSGSGKSFLMECVAELMPPEDVHYFSRLTPQALYYLEPDALTHKLLIVDERDGSEESEYPIRTLQTRKVLKLAVPVKDPSSGKIKTVVLEIFGPIAYMESTTDEKINPENANRCFELYLDESEKQTLAIFEAQRKSRTLEGWKTERQKEKTLCVHHNAQRLLRPLKVIIPYVELIDFPAAWLRGRRDNDRFLSLIEGIALLHQFQRKILSDGGQEYIESSPEDYAMAHDLAHQIFAHGNADLPKPLSDFYGAVKKIMREKARTQKCRIDEFTFSRRDIREKTRLPDHMVKRHMKQLEELEYVQVRKTSQGGSFLYRMLPDLDTPEKLAGLTPPEILSEKWNNWNKVGQRRLSQLSA